jgi:hypothetical protein
VTEEYIVPSLSFVLNFENVPFVLQRERYSMRFVCSLTIIMVQEKLVQGIGFDPSEFKSEFVATFPEKAKELFPVNPKHTHRFQA